MSAHNRCFGLAMLGLVALSLPARAQDAAPPAAVLQLEWTLAEVDGQPAGYEATLSLTAKGGIAGRAPCNRYFGTLTGALPQFSPTGIGATRMACDAMEQEQAFMNLLQAADRLTWSDKELHLSGAGHQMVFRRPLD